MSFFNKLKEGLAKTKGNFDEKINNVFANFRKVDEELMDELEEALILSDVGPTTASDIIDDLRLTIKRNKIEDAELVKEELKKKIESILNSNENELKLDAKYGDGIDNFIMELKNMMFHGKIDVNQEVYITNARHKDALVKTYESLECVERSIEAGMPEDFFTIDLMNAYEKLGLIIGESVEEDLVNEIFSKFCTGK